jgi:asparagine synthase (glutamine-hydrolysing)
VTVAEDSEAQVAVVLLGRVHYRDDIERSLRHQHPGAPLTDAALALALYLQAGINGLQTLEGEFALAAWDGRTRRLIGMRDPLGSWPLYWTARGPALTMGTSLRTLVEDNRPRSLDLEYMAEFLTRPFVDAEVTCPRTAVPGCRRVPPGTLVEVNHDGSSREHAYWDWASRIRPVPADSLASAAGRFRELLDRAVRERMRGGTVATHLSGGMDSSAVTALARQTSGERPGRRPVATISLVYRAAELARERDHMDLVLQRGGPVEPYFVEADVAVGFDWFARPLPRHDEPYAGLWSLAANRLLVDVAERCRAGTVLTGAGGDEVLSYRPLHIADLLRRGRIVSGLREAAAWAFGQGQGLWSVLRKCAAEPLWASALGAISGSLPRCRLKAWLHSGRLSVPPWVRPEFARQHQLHERCHEYSRCLFAPPAESSETLLRLATCTGDWARWYLYLPRGMNISHPFLDPRVVCYALGVPRGIRAAPGDPKPLLRAATQGLLPDAIRNRREKTGFDGPRARGVALHFSRLEELIRGSRIHDLGIFDVEKLLASLHEVAVGIGIKHNEWLDRTLACLAWYEHCA